MTNYRTLHLSARDEPCECGSITSRVWNGFDGIRYYGQCFICMKNLQCEPATEEAKA